MQKTPDEIKYSLENCGVAYGCNGCAYRPYKIASAGCGYERDQDVLAYIQQLEKERGELKLRNIFLETNWKMAERERNAAVVDIRNAKWMLCHVCKNYYRPDPTVRHYACKEFGEFSDFLMPSDFAEEGYDFPSLCGKFIWRGVCDENTKEADTPPSQRGLYGKYTVIKNETGETVDDCFVLRPNKDPAALKALQIYADFTDDKQLAEDLYKWIEAAKKDVKEE